VILTQVAEDAPTQVLQASQLPSPEVLYPQAPAALQFPDEQPVVPQ